MLKIVCGLGSVFWIIVRMQHCLCWSVKHRNRDAKRPMGKLYPCIPVYIDTHTHIQREASRMCPYFFSRWQKEGVTLSLWVVPHIKPSSEDTNLLFIYFFEHCSKYRFCNVSFYSVITKSVNVLLFVNVSLLNSASFTSHNFALAQQFFFSSVFPRGEISPRGRRVLSFVLSPSVSTLSSDSCAAQPVLPRAPPTTLAHSHADTPTPTHTGTTAAAKAVCVCQSSGAMNQTVTHVALTPARLHRIRP